MTQSQFLLVCLLLTVVIASTWLRRRMTDVMLFYPERGQTRTPGDLGLTYEETHPLAQDGVHTEFWWMPADGPVVLFFHGNAGTMGDRLDIARQLHDLGAAVAFSEYRGYGNSEGRPNESGLYLDARAALVQARQLAGNRPVIVAGRSLGGAVAIELAATEAVDGLVVESSFTSLADIAGATGIPFAGRLAAYDFDSRSKIAQVSAPILITHGDADELVPFAMGRELETTARHGASPEVRFHAVSGGGHNDIILTGGNPYWQAWASFLAHVETLPPMGSEREKSDPMDPS